MPSAPCIAAIVLAAGRSSRMGHFKLVADVGGQPMIRRTVGAVVASRARPIVVVTGHEADAIGHALAGLAVRLVHNANFAEGLSTSLKTGLAALDGDIDGALIVLGDMPGLTAADIDRVIAAHAPGRIVVPVYGGKRGNPVLWPKAMFGRLESLTGDAGARRLLDELQADVHPVEMESAAIFEDIDTPDALARLRQRETNG